MQEAIERNSTLLTDRRSAREPGAAPHNPCGAIVDGIEQLVASTVGISVDQVRSRRPGHRNDAQAIVLVAARRCGAASLLQLAERYGYATISGVTSAIRRLEQRASSDADLGELLDGVLYTQRRAA